MAQSFDAWLNSLGPVTRYGLGFSLLLTILTYSGALSPVSVVLLPETFTQLQLWRMLTSAFFFGTFSFPWLVSIAMFTTYLNYNEENDFKGKPGDFVWMMILLVIGLSLGGSAFGMFLTSHGLMMALCWVFCKRHPEVRMRFYGFEFNANMFPWVLLVFHLILGNNILVDLLGIFIGHVFFFVKDVLPKTHRRDPFRTPAWFLRRFFAHSAPSRFGTIHPDEQFARARPPPPTGQTAPGGATHRWGTGRTLGSN